MPFWTTLPAGTLDAMDTEFGAAGGTAVVIEEAFVVPVLASWARWGANDRIELSGGASLPLNPFEVVIHGLARAQVAGPLDEGFALTAGAGAQLFTRSGLLALSVPVAVGHEGPQGGSWVSAAPVLYPTAEVLAATVAVELGGAIRFGQLPLYVQGGAELGSFYTVHALVGVGIPLDW